MVREARAQVRTDIAVCLELVILTLNVVDVATHEERICREVQLIGPNILRRDVLVVLREALASGPAEVRLIAQILLQVVA